MPELTLISELFPRGVVMRLRRGTTKRFSIHWQFQQRAFSIEGDVLIETIRDALTAIAAQQHQEGML